MQPFWLILEWLLGLP